MKLQVKIRDINSPKIEQNKSKELVIINLLLTCLLALPALKSRLEKLVMFPGYHWILILRANPHR